MRKLSRTDRETEQTEMVNCEQNNTYIIKSLEIDCGNTAIIHTLSSIRTGLAHVGDDERGNKTKYFQLAGECC